MIVRHNFLYALLALSAVLSLSRAHFPEYCAECEQEIWEQVPCSEISSTPAPPTPTTEPGTPPTEPATTEIPIITTTTTVLPPITTSLPTYRPQYISTPSTPTDIPYITTPLTPYKKCYCECKLGCKEFCRKVSVANPKQQITQISSTGDYAPGGQIEYTHSHQRKYYPKYGVAPKQPVQQYKPYPVTYSEVAGAASAPAVNNINAPNYTLEELAQLLSTAYGSRKGYPVSPPAPPPPPPQQQQHQHQPPVYYSPVPQLIKTHYKPLISKVPEHRSIIKTAAAAVASSGRAVAKAKTPYEEVVATSAPIYESTTSYPLPPPPPPPQVQPEPPKSYPEPQPVPIPQPQTESYPTQTEAYPDKSYEAPESHSVKPESSSSFDLAIDNYLKNFGYGNQVRDLDY